MDEFAKLPPSERQVYFEQTAERMALPAHLIEKDFWVCWTLRVLFGIAEYRDHLTFKGGTSLSKVYQAIERFSEDIDFALSRDLLGFAGDAAPDAQGISGVERERRLEALSETCRIKIGDDFHPKLKAAIKDILGDDGWKLEFHDSEKKNQVFRFTYPKTSITPHAEYNPPFIRLELTARTDNHPSENVVVTPYINDHFPDAIRDSSIAVRALCIERTFWEKATILHQFHHQRDPENVPEYHSRHYYDVSQLARRGFADRAIALIELLPEVADHKRVFYRQGWARYDLARFPTTLKLAPNAAIKSALSKDYEKMQEMMFADSPTFDSILDDLSKLEQRINRLNPI